MQRDNEKKSLDKTQKRKSKKVSSSFSKLSTVLLVLGLILIVPGALDLFADVSIFASPTVPIYIFAGGIFFTILGLPISKKAKLSSIGFLVGGTVAAAGALGMFAPGILPFTLPVAPFYFLAGGALLAVFFTILALPISTKAKVSLGFALIGAGAAGLGALGMFAPGILPFTLPYPGIILGAGAVFFLLLFLLSFKYMGSSKDNLVSNNSQIRTDENLTTTGTPPSSEFGHNSEDNSEHKLEQASSINKPNEAEDSQSQTMEQFSESGKELKEGHNDTDTDTDTDPDPDTHDNGPNSVLG